MRPLLTESLSFIAAEKLQTGSSIDARKALNLILNLKMQGKSLRRSDAPLLANLGLVSATIQLEVPVNGGRRSRSGVQLTIALDVLIMVFSAAWTPCMT